MRNKGGKKRMENRRKTKKKTEAKRERKGLSTKLRDEEANRVKEKRET